MEECISLFNISEQVYHSEVCWVGSLPTLECRYDSRFLSFMDSAYHTLDTDKCLTVKSEPSCETSSIIKEKEQSRDVRGKSLCNYQFVLKQFMLTARLDRLKCFSMGVFVATPIGKRAERLTCWESREQTSTNTHTGILLQRWLPTSRLLEDWSPLNHTSKQAVLMIHTMSSAQWQLHELDLESVI